MRLASEGLAPIVHVGMPHANGSSRVNDTFHVDDIRGRRVILDEHSFRTSFQRRVWRRHCNGVSMRDIAADLGEHLSRVQRAIKNVRDEWQASRHAPNLYELAKICDRAMMATVLRAMRYAQKHPADAEALIEQAEALLDL